ncbi:AraC family ligand binding domain-containing protein [Streptomyces sp. NPDC057302]|uniref:AraC family ligand binding domain-containing protein n=1 Tax=Streptomyces sp. NPDC057302 TaxID=3346094 RepID=UPI003643ED35
MSTPASASASAVPVFVGPEQTAAAGRGQISVLWSLGRRARDLDVAVVRLAPGAGVGEHAEKEFGVLFTVLTGTGELRTPDETWQLTPGALAWLPAGVTRRVDAGQQGLVYTTAHRRHPALGTDPAAADGSDAGEPVCLLGRVCPDCGRLAAERDARYCSRCGTPLAD